MRLVVVVGVGGVLVVCSASGDACKRRSAASTCNSITAYTSRVGAMLRGYRFAMSAILIFSASTAFSTRYVSFISSAFGKCVDFFGYAWVRADNFSSYCSTATLIFECTFFRTSSSLIPSFAYKLDSVMMTAFCFPPLVTPCSGRSKLSSVVNATIRASAASSLAASWVSSVWSGLVREGELDLFYWGLLIFFCTSISPSSWFCILSYFASMSAWNVANFLCRAYSIPPTLASSPVCGVCKYSAVFLCSASMLLMCRFMDATSSLVSRASMRF